jgi:hypothetical protein
MAGSWSRGALRQAKQLGNATLDDKRLYVDNLANGVVAQIDISH